MIKINHKSVWRPHYIANSVVDLDRDELKRIGITHLVFDIDNTLVKKHSNSINLTYIKYLKSLSSSGFILMLGSNRRRSVKNIAKSIDAIAVQPHGISMKPFKSYYNQVRYRSDTLPAHIAMIGDNIVNDVFGANRAGLITIMVESAIHTAFLNHCYIHYLRGQNSR